MRVASASMVRLRESSEAELTCNTVNIVSTCTLSPSMMGGSSKIGFPGTQAPPGRTEIMYGAGPIIEGELVGGSNKITSVRYA